MRAMTCHDDRIAAHKHAAREAVPGLTDAQLEAVWALWAYKPPSASLDDQDHSVTGYLTMECGASIEDARKAVRALHKFDLCLF